MRAKMQHPGEFYAFLGLDHTDYWLTGAKNPETLAAQVRRMLDAGGDGFKLIEGKPTTMKYLPLHADDPYFDGFFAECERLGVPILWHVADPEEFWDPLKTPSWALSRGWGYGPGDVPKESLYAHVENVLASHPRLKVIFAHFYFLSADLRRAARFLDEHPSVGMDLAPGVEMLHNLSAAPDKAREFFLDYDDRIFFGTDLSDGYTPREAAARSGIVTRFLETQDVYTVPQQADFLLGSPQDGEIRGVCLPEQTLAKIERENFQNLAGINPRKPDESLMSAMLLELDEKARLLQEAE